MLVMISLTAATFSNIANFLYIDIQAVSHVADTKLYMPSNFLQLEK